MIRPNRQNRLWSIVLAGGDGERVSPLIQRWLGFPKPKQYCSFVGSRSMFQHTLDRALGLTGPDCLVTVVARHHQREAMAQVEGRNVGTVLFQPENRDTVGGIFLPLAYIRAHNPQATVVIYPSDHFIFPEERFLEIVQRAVWTAEWLSSRLVLLTVPPDRLELEYGWVQPGRNLARSVDCRIRHVRRFVEKPDEQEARRLWVAEGLWNTLVLAVRVETLWRIGWRIFPDMMPLFERITAAFGTAEEAGVLNRMYEIMPARNFSSDLLGRIAEEVVAIELSDVLWCDWGKPARIVQTLQRLGKTPNFRPALVESAC